LALEFDTDKLKVWFDPEGDFLEVIFADREGFFRETSDDRVMVRIDTNGNVIGFNVLNVSTLPKAKELSVQPGSPS